MTHRLGNPPAGRRIGPGRLGSREYRRAVANNRHSIGLPAETLAGIEAENIVLPDLDVVRRYRLQRVRDRLRDLDYAGIILYDPAHIRYACDTANMTLWTAHNACRYLWVGMADEWPMIVLPHTWDQAGYDGVVEPGMVLCVEAYVARRGWGEGVKLEQQVLALILHVSRHTDLHPAMSNGILPASPSFTRWVRCRVGYGWAVRCRSPSSEGLVADSIHPHKPRA